MSTEAIQGQTESAAAGIPGLDILMNVPIALTVEVGRTRMTLSQLLETREGSIVELDRLIEQPLDILVNDSRVAQGVVVMTDDQFGVQITEVFRQPESALSLAGVSPESEPGSGSTEDVES